MALAIVLHMLSAVIWVGGMFFAYMALRPVTGTLLEPPLRLKLWSQVFARFFPWVWLAILLLFGTGFWMILVFFGGMGAVGVHVHLMLAIALIMAGLFIYINIGPFKRLRTGVAAENWAEGGQNLNQIRQIVGLNLVLGLITIAIASAGRYLA